MKERYKNNRVIIPVLVIGILLMVYLLVNNPDLRLTS